MIAPVTPSPDRRRGGGRWIAAVVGLLLANTGAVVVLIAASHHGPSHVVVDDYYRRAVAWDGEMAQARANLALAWDVALGLGRSGDGALAVEVTVRERSGAPIVGAAVTASAFHRARAGEVEAARRVEDRAGAGCYRGALALPRGGIYEVSLVVEVGDRRWADVLVREVVAAAAGGPR